MVDLFSYVLNVVFCSSKILQKLNLLEFKNLCGFSLHAG